jgi:ABC-2 type transport system permease protein
VVGVLIRMKLRVLRHSMRGKQAGLTIGGAALGLPAALLTILVASVDLDNASADTDLLAAIYLLWAVGWMFAPVFTGGGDETLRPEHFALLPIAPLRLAGGLLGAAFIGVPAIVTLIAFCGLFVHASGPGGVLVAVVAVPAQLVFVVLLSRVTMAALGAVLQSRRGRDLGVLLAGLVGLSAFLVQAILRTLGPVLLDGSSPWLSALLRWLPAGWGPVAVDAASRSDWLLALGALAGLVALCSGLFWAWALLLRRRTTRAVVSAGPSARTARAALGSRLSATPVGAVVGKELRTWVRDARRRVALLSTVMVGVVLVVAPALQEGNTGMLPFSGLTLVVMGSLLAGNLYGMDGSALWHTLVTPGAEAADIRGRQLAWLLLVGPVTVGLAAVLPGLTDPATYPWVLALTPAMLGGGAGLVVLLSVLTAYAMPDQRSNPFASGNNPGLLRLALQLGIMLLLAVVALPVVGVVWLGSEVPVVRWLGVPVGIGVGVLCWWWWGRLAANRLSARGPELLAEVGKPV